MHKKRGQATLFIIIAIVVVAIALILFFYFRPQIFKSKIESKEILETKAKVNGLVEKATFDALYLIGKQGGYIELPKESLIAQNQEIAYALYFDKNNLPSLENIQGQISSYLEKTLQLYFSENQELFNTSINNTNNSVQETNFDLNEIHVSTKIKDNDIIVSLELPTTIKGKEETFSIHTYNDDIPFDFNHIYDVAKEIVVKKQSNQQIDSFFFLSRDVSVSIYPLDSSRTVYELRQKDEINNQDYIFNVAIIKT